MHGGWRSCPPTALCDTILFMVQLFMAMNIEAEIRDLKRRVSELEGSFGFLSQQIKAVHKDLLAFQTRAEQRFIKPAEHVSQFGECDGRVVGKAFNDQVLDP